jgi:hypothetical protein
MTGDFLTVLPNLSIGVVCVLALVYIAIKFLSILDARVDKHEKSMRDLEASVRTNLTDQLTKNTIALADVAKVLGRVVRHLDGDGH